MDCCPESPTDHQPDRSPFLIPIMKPRTLLLPAILCALAASAPAQDAGRVSPASLPLPLPGAGPLPPDQLRAQNPWNLPMTGVWRFQLTSGRIEAGQFRPTAGNGFLSASSSETSHPPKDAFDGASDTRWCATGGDFPQWLQADLGDNRRVSGVKLAWENADDRYQCRIEGRVKGGAWKTLGDAAVAPGIGNGPLKFTPAEVRYVRVVITANTPGSHWASLREFQVLVAEDGRETAWRPPAPKPADSNPATRDAFAALNFNDAAWDDQPVPSNWEMAGYSLPTYNSVDESVGLYRRKVAVPAAWAGRRVYWRFDGAFDGAEIFVNGQKAGYHESGYTAFDVDLTGLVKPGEVNLFAVRVSKTTPSYECDTGDYQSMGGIYRDTSLISVPQTRIDDLTVRTPLAANYRDATLAVQVHVTGARGQAVAVEGELFSADGRPAGVKVSGAGTLQADGTTQVALSAPAPAPALWSAEKPNLYYVVLSLSVDGKLLERVQERFGFRQIEVKDRVVLWNGVPVKCTGVCRHDFWADRGYALTEVNWVQDLALIKDANINAIRTSHYNHARRFLELCDEKGMYILDEVPYCWIDDGVKDPAYLPYLLLRARETLARDKNRPCVLAWSIGNENPVGPNSQSVLDQIRAADPTHPAFVSERSPGDYQGQSWADRHYPDPKSVDGAAQDTRWGSNLSEHPHTFYEKEVQDYDPGMSDLWSEPMVKTWEKMWKSPTLLGSFIWEWQNQGIADKNDDTTTDFYEGPGRLRQENNKGVVDAYRKPKPEWWIVKTVYSPVAAGARTVSPAGGECVVSLTNRYSFTDLQELTCRWTALDAGAALQSGVMHIACAPMGSVQASFPAPAGMTTLRLEFHHPDGRTVMACNLAAEGAAPRPAPAALAPGGALTAQDSPDVISIRNAVQQISFNKRTGALASWRVNGRDVLVGGPTLNLGEARGKNKGGDDKGIYRAPQPPVLTEPKVAVKSGAGAGGNVRVVVTGEALTEAGGPALGTLELVYDIKPSAEIAVKWTLNWTADDTRLWEQGVKFAAGPGLTVMNWQRDAYFTDYPAGHLGEPAGTARAGDVSFRATKRGLRWMTLTDSGGAGLALLPLDGPLMGRADAGAKGPMLLASSGLAGDYGLTRQWVEEHAIQAGKGKPLSGSFVLRAINGVPPRR